MVPRHLHLPGIYNLFFPLLSLSLHGLTALICSLSDLHCIIIITYLHIIFNSLVLSGFAVLTFLLQSCAAEPSWKTLKSKGTGLIWHPWLLTSSEPQDDHDVCISLVHSLSPSLTRINGSQLGWFHPQRTLAISGNSFCCHNLEEGIWLASHR